MTKKTAAAKTALEGMRTVPIASLKFDPRNPRTHGKRNIAAIRSSLELFGQVLPVIVHKGIIVGGNGLVTAMGQLGWTECRVVELDKLSDANVTMLRIALNRSAELAEWNFEVLAEDFKALVGSGDFTFEELEGLGWAKFDLDPLLSSEWKPPPAGDELGGELPGGRETKADKERTSRLAALEEAIATMRDQHRAQVNVLLEALGQAEAVLARMDDPAAAVALPMVRAARALAEVSR